MFLIVIATIFVSSYSSVMSNNNCANLYQDCGKLFHPPNYMDQLPSLNLPYLNNVKIPSHHSVGLNNIPIKPTPVKTTKVINVVTTYVYRNPVCVKIKGEKSMCQLEPTPNRKENLEYVISKEYYVKDRKMKQPYNRMLSSINGRYDDTTEESSSSSSSSEMEEDDILEMYVQSSKEPRPFRHIQTKTPNPNLTPGEISEMLIEDRLDQLETILPHYTRRRTYQTSTITVTKVRSNNRATATLMVKNCIPQGYNVCPSSTKIKKRLSKVARLSNENAERHYFG